MKPYLLQDYVAAEKKALSVGAKKFFLQVRIIATASAVRTLCIT
jgi:hypothetical protein